MRYIFRFLLVLVLFGAGCSGSIRQYEKEFVLNEDRLIFFDENGIKKSSLEKAFEGYKELWEVDYAPRAIVIATKSPAGRKFRKQMNILLTHIGGGRAHQFLYVEATPRPIDRHTHRTTKQQAIKLLGNNSFKILFYDRDGKFVTSETNVMDSSAILAVLGSIE